MRINTQTLFVYYIFFGLLFPNFYGILNTRGAIVLNVSIILLPIFYIY